MRKVSSSVVLLILMLLLTFAGVVAAYPGEWMESIEAEASGEYEVNLIITAPDGQPATWTYVYVYRDSPSRHGYYARYGYTEDDSNVTFQLGRGYYTAVLWRGWASAKFLALYRFYVRENATFMVDVGSLTVPVNLVAIKPLDGRPFTQYAYFDVRILTYPILGTYEFSVDEAGYLRLYLPANLKCSCVYRDYASPRYILFKANVVIKREATIIFDASKTGQVKPTPIIPEGISVDWMYVSVSIGGNNLPWAGVWLDIGDTIVVSTGKYEAKAYVTIYYQWEDVGHYGAQLGYYIKSLNVASRKVTELAFGGEIHGFAKASKKTYKPAETIRIDYWFEDAYKHKLTDAYNVENYEWTNMPLYLNIYDDEGLLESEQLEWYSPSDTVYLYTSMFAGPGTYTIEIILDTGAYQGNVTASTKITIK